MYDIAINHPSECATQSAGRPLNAAKRECNLARALLWRLWFGEWVRAARYVSLRQLIHDRLVVGELPDKSGGTHHKLYEELQLEVRSAR